MKCNQKTSIVSIFILALFFSEAFGQLEIIQIIDSASISEDIKLSKIDSLLKTRINEKDSVNIDVISNLLSNRYYSKNRVAEALATLNFSIQYHASDKRNLQDKWRRKGLFNRKLGNYLESISDYKQVITIDPESILAARSYISLGRNYYYLGDYESAILNYEFAERLLKEKKEYTRLISNYLNAFDSYSEVKTPYSFKKNLENLLLADTLSQEVPVSNINRINIYRTLGIYYSEYDTRDTLKGRLYLEKALSLAKSYNDSIRISQINVDLGLLYDEYDTRKAINFHKNALKYCLKEDDNTKTIVYGNLGHNYARLHQFDESIKHLQEAFKFISGYAFDKISQEKKRKLLRQNLDNHNLWPMLSKLGETYNLQHEKTNIKGSLDSSLMYYKLTDYTLDLYQNRSRFTSSKFLWRADAAEIYTRALRSCYQTNDIETGFYFMEKNKALLLTEEIDKLNTIQKTKLPKEIILKERNLQNELLELKQQNNKQIAIINRKTDSIGHLQEEIQNYLNVKIEDDIDLTSISEIQKRLSNEEVILEYHIAVDNGFGIYPNTNTGYGILLTKTDKHFFQLNNLNELKTLLDDFSIKNRQSYKTKEDEKQYQKIAFKLYKKLIPASINQHIENKKLIIIPDNYLNTIPFESLVVSDSIPNDYLIYHHQVSYKYSYNFHLKNDINQSEQKMSIASFAPLYFQNQNLPKLEHSLSEIEAISPYFNNKIYAKKSATKKAFIDQLQKTGILHLATHANANDSITPWIAFADEKMYLDEISVLQNKTSLVVLSACNTTLGQIHDGEGVMSLSRAFFYGGTQSTISSLWQVNDKATKLIMHDFYKNLKGGLSKDKALHLAKVSYLETHQLSEKSPYYWASLVLIGDTNSIPGSSFHLSIWKWFLIVGLIFIFSFVLLKSRKHYF